VEIVSSSGAGSEDDVLVLVLLLSEVLSTMAMGIWIVRKPAVAVVPVVVAVVVVVVGWKSVEMLRLINVRGEMRIDGWKVWFIRLTSICTPLHPP